MNSKEASALRIGDKVTWQKEIQGTVLEHNYMAVKIRWEDGIIAIYPHHGCIELEKNQ